MPVVHAKDPSAAMPTLRLLAVLMLIAIITEVTNQRLDHVILQMVSVQRQIAVRFLLRRLLTLNVRVTRLRMHICQPDVVIEPCVRIKNTIITL